MLPFAAALILTCGAALAAGQPPEKPEEPPPKPSEMPAKLPGMVDNTWTAEAEKPLRDRLTGLGCRNIYVDDGEVVADCPHLGIGNEEYEQSHLFRSCPPHQLIGLDSNGHLACLPAK